MDVYPVELFRTQDELPNLTNFLSSLKSIRLDIKIPIELRLHERLPQKGGSDRADELAKLIMGMRRLKVRTRDMRYTDESRYEQAERVDQRENSSDDVQELSRQLIDKPGMVIEVSRRWTEA